MAPAQKAPTPPDNTVQLDPKLKDKSKLERETICTAEPDLAGCDGILATKRAEDEAAKLRKQQPFGGLPMSKPAVVGVEAIRAAAMDAKPVLQAGQTSKYQGGPFLIFNSEGTVASGPTNKKMFSLQSANTDRSIPAAGYAVDHSKANVAVQFMPSGSDYNIKIYSIDKDNNGSANNSIRYGRGNRGGAYQPGVNEKIEASDSVGVAKKKLTLKLAELTKGDAMAANKYTVTDTLNLKEELMLADTDKTLDGWTYTILKANSKVMPSDKEADGTFLAEVWKSPSFSSGNSDYAVGGVWLLAPADGDRNKTKFAAFVSPNMRLGGEASGTTDTAYSVQIKPELTGGATYKGFASGLYVDDMNAVKRLLGIAELTADFNTGTRGTLSGEINGLVLGGEKVGGVIQLPKLTITQYTVISAEETAKDPHNLGSIGSRSFQGDWAAVFTGPTAATVANDTKPTGVVGTVSGYSKDEKHHFAASFGAKEVKPATTTGQ